MSVTYLQCNWCTSNATRPVRLASGQLVGACIVHLDAMTISKDAYGTTIEERA